MPNAITNIRLVFDKDDGGIRQSERQLVPALKERDINVVGVVIGSGLGNYADQNDDFRIWVEGELGGYAGNLFSRIKSVFGNHWESKKIAKRVHTEIRDTLGSETESIVIINVRRVNLIPVALELSKLVNGKVIYHIGAGFRKGPFGINHLVYWFLRRKQNLFILANSKFTARSYKIAPDNYVYPGVDIARISGTPIVRDVRSELGIPAEAVVFLYLARVSRGKAPDLLVEAFLKSKHATETKAHLIIVGTIQDVELRSELQTLINAYDAAERIHIVGPKSDVANWYAAANIFVNSQRGIEAFGISIVEAMAAGLPILTSALGGPSETVKEKVNGWLVYNLTVQGYQDAIDCVFNNRAKWDEYAKRSIALSKEYSVSNQVARYIDFLNNF